MTLRPLAILLSIACAGALYAEALPGDLVSGPPRTVWNLDPDWRCLRQDAAGAERADFDDAGWQRISLPHTVNDVDTFDKLITGEGDRSVWQGRFWYRKHFTVPAGHRDGKVLLEVEGVRQIGRFFLNGKPVGHHDNGITGCGFDLTPLVRFGEENVLAVQVDNRFPAQEVDTRERFQWDTMTFNPIYGGLSGHVRLHLTGTLYQTLPLYRNLGTTGMYVHAAAMDVAARTAVVTVESEVRNESGRARTVALSAQVVDATGTVQAIGPGIPVAIPAGTTATLVCTGPLRQVQWWDPLCPNLYTVHSVLGEQGTEVDRSSLTTGFRSTAFKGGAGTGGVFINGRLALLKGYAQRTTNEWAGLGTAYPDWMHDFTMRLMAESQSCLVRWMHTAPRRSDVNACDQAGIVQIMPAGDAEKDAKGRQWEQRIEVMRDAIIAFRNNPSIVLYEAGNDGISPDHMRQMRELKERLDPHGGRAMGCRTMLEPSYPQGEWLGTMLRQRYTDQARDRFPIVETEHFRQEAARRFWDDASPPHFGFKPRPGDEYAFNQETFSIEMAKWFEDFTASKVISVPGVGRWSGHAAIIFADSNSHGRNKGSEVCRVSGKVDAVRIPKTSYFVTRVMQNPRPDIHIMGHWTYPAGTTKTVQVACNTDAVELLVNGKSRGRVATPRYRIIFSFPDTAWEPGEVRAIGYLKGVKACEMTLATVGPPAAIRLTPMTAPGGLRADGAEVALIDVEVVDARGRRCPTDEARVDFAVEGPCVWRGGYNSGRIKSTNNLWLDTECGINRVALRSTLTAGPITIRATREGLTPAAITITPLAIPLVGGMSPVMPPRLSPHATAGPLASTVPFRCDQVTTAPAAPTMGGSGMPDPFAFPAATGIDLFSTSTSQPITVTGLQAPAPISIASASEDASYAINQGPFQNEPGVVRNGDVVRVRLGSGSQAGQTHVLTLDIGGRTAPFRITTRQ